MFALGEYAREISFIDDELKIITKKFIYNSDNLRIELRNLGYKSFYIKASKKKNGINKNNSNFSKGIDSISNSSEISLGNPLSIFNDTKILCIYKNNQRPILCPENF